MKLSQESSSVYIEPKFEKRPLKLDFDKTEIVCSFLFPDQSKEFIEIHERVQSLAEQLLFEWKHVPVVFPKSIIEMDHDQLKNLSENLFVSPTYDELESLSIDASGKPVKLNAEQLDQIRRTATFDVASKNFPGKFHRWQIVNYAQQGWEKADAIMYKNLGFALGLVIVQSKTCLGKVLSGIKVWKNEFVNLIDMLIGLPKKYINFGEINAYIHDELTKFLLLNLTVDEEQSELFKVTVNSISSAFTLDPEVRDKILLSAPYFYRTPDNFLIDLRLFDAAIRAKIDPILNELVENNDERYEELEKLRQSLISKYEAEKLSNAEIIEKTQEALKEEWYRILYESVLSSKELEAISPGIGKTLCDLAKSLNIMKDEKKRYNDDKQKHLEAYKEELKKKHRLKSSVGEWVVGCLKVEEDKFIEKSGFIVHERAIDKCREEGLNQAAYLIAREMMFLREKKDLIIKEELKKPMTPLCTFSYDLMIWNPSNYIITKEPKGNHYKCQEYVTYKNTTKYPFWRWTNFLIRTWCYSWNSLFIFSFVVPFVSSVSFRSIFAIEAYQPYKKFNRDVGRMEPDTSKTIRTLSSRIIAIIAYVKQARARFERLPDKGMIGKNTERVFNRIWNYFFVGAVGITGLIVIYPPVCIGLSTLSLGAGLLAPLWFPISSLIYNLFCMFIVDLDLMRATHKQEDRLFGVAFRIVLNPLISGAILPVFNLLAGLILLPSCSAIITLFSLFRRRVRACQDSFFYYGLFQGTGRVPACDTPLARRISGPGLASKHFYQIKPEQALAAVEIYLEKKILGVYVNFIRAKLDEPIEVFDKVFGPLMKPYGYQYYSSKDKSKLQKDISAYCQDFEEIKHEKLKALNLNLFMNGSGKIRLAENSLQIVLFEATKLVKFNYENVILKYYGQTSKELFETASLRKNDWTGLTGRILEEIFGVGIMKPLEAMHEVFDLKVDHLNLIKYTKMINESNIRDDLEKVEEKYRPEVEKVRVEIHEQSVMETFNVKKEMKSTDFLALGKKLQNNRLTRLKASQEMFIPSHLPGISASVAALTYNQTTVNEMKIEYKSITDLEGRLNRYFRFN